MNNLFNMLMEANTCKQVEELIEFIEKNHAVTWRPVGDDKMNYSRINIGTDPAAGVTERITNAIDGVLEKLWFENGCPGPDGIRSPREAAEKWLGIKNGRLVNVKSDTELRKLGDNVRVIMKESGLARKPTVEVRDKGIGILAKDFRTTIVGLNQDNKINKFFLSGSYGQGGSSALAHSEYTIIISRKFSMDESIVYPVAFTIVRYNAGDYNVEKQGYYEYITDAAQDMPFQLDDITIEQFECGTLVRHVQMDVGNHYQTITQLTGSFWYLIHFYLFDSILPVILTENRPKYPVENRTIPGNHRRLTRGNTIDSNSSRLNFRQGKVEITWWVLKSDDDTNNNKRRITLYSTESHPIILTYNGQKQGDFPNTIIRDQLKLPYLDKHLIVHVNCDQVDGETRRHLFPTTREAVKKNEVSEELRGLITDFLDSEEDLRKHNEERKKMLLSRDNEDTSENLKKRLASKINKVMNVGEEGKSGRVQPPHSTKKDYKKKPIPIKNPPTYLTIVSKEPRLVYAGKSFFIRFETDAESDLFTLEDFSVTVEPSEFASYTGLTTVKKGHGTIHFKASEDIKEGDVADVSVVLKSPGYEIGDNTSLKVVPIPIKAGKGKGAVGAPNIKIMKVTKDDLFWQQEQWDEQSVSKVVIETDSITIFMSVENKNLTKLTNKALRNRKYSGDSIIETYCEHIGFYSFLAFKSFIDNQREDVDVLNNELRTASESICGMIDDFFDVIAMEEKEVAAAVD